MNFNLLLFLAFVVNTCVVTAEPLAHLNSKYAALPESAVSLKRTTYAAITPKIELSSNFAEQKEQLIIGIGRTLDYLHSDQATKDYKNFEAIGLSREQVAKSLKSFFVHLINSMSQKELVNSLKNDFAIYRSKGHDGNGTVRFTGYFQPVYKASKVRNSKFKYPIFSKPSEFHQWQGSHPTRVQLEGYDGLGGNQALLKGLEIAYLNNRFEAFMIHVQGSAILEFQDSSRIAVGFDEGTNYPFRGISKEFMQKHGTNWTELNKFFSKNPSLLDEQLQFNNRYIFFKASESPDPIGSIGVPVIAEQSIATDNKFLPPGGIGIIRARLPVSVSDGSVLHRDTARIVLNLDTGSAIKGPGRVDVFMGTGKDAHKKASALYTQGELFYLMVE